MSTLFIVRRCRLKSGHQNRQVSMQTLPNSDFFDGLTAASLTNEGCDEDNPLYNKTVRLDDLNVENIVRDRLRYIEPIAEGAFGKVSLNYTITFVINCLLWWFLNRWQNLLLFIYIFTKNLTASY